jgi:hypothetical protein
VRASLSPCRSDNRLGFPAERGWRRRVRPGGACTNPGGGPRYAIPYFFHPDLETQLAPLPGCVSAGEPARFEPQTVSEFMAHFRRSNYERFRAADAAA